jgi:hypothetical protein
MPTRKVVEMILKELLDQLPEVTVHDIVLVPTEPVEGEQAEVRIDVGDDTSVICSISADGRLSSAYVLRR